MRFTFEVEGKAEFDRSFNRVRENISDLRPVWDRIERAFNRIEDEQFKSEGAKGRTGRWKPLSRRYAERKAVEFPGMPILQRSGRLYKALTGKSSDAVVVKTKEEFAIGTNLFYAAFHQTGTSKMPAREPISFSDDSRRTLTKEIQKGLLEIIRKETKLEVNE